MLNLLVIISILLVVAILVAVFRVSTLLELTKKREKAKKIFSNWNNAQGLLLIVFLIVGVAYLTYYSIKEFDNYNLPIASEHAVFTETLFWITMAITIIIFIGTQIFLFGFSHKYRYKENKKAHYFPHNNKLEIIWTIIPAIVLAILIISGLKEWNKVTASAPEEAEVIEVMGYQYAWAFRYPGKDGNLGAYDYRKIDATNTVGIDLNDKNAFDDFMPLQLVIPKDKPVLLKIRARDVIHSVYNPHFRVQMNAVPGMPTKFWFVPTVSTNEMRKKTNNPEFNYELVCNKICGMNHYGMRGIITVLDEHEYNVWYKEQQKNTWLKNNEKYLDQVPESLKKIAREVSGLSDVLTDTVSNLSKTIADSTSITTNN